MKIKHIRGDVWQVQAQIPDEHGEEESYIPITIRFIFLSGDLVVEFVRGWTYGSPADDDELWLLKSWLEEHESEIVAQVGD